MRVTWAGESDMPGVRKTYPAEVEGHRYDCACPECDRDERKREAEGRWPRRILGLELATRALVGAQAVGG